MYRQLVTSSDIHSIGYENGILEIEFISGGIYQYFGVSENIYKNLMIASSHGSYFANNIKNSYPTKKIC